MKFPNNIVLPYGKVTISPYCIESVLPGFIVRSVPTSQAWGAVNRALFYPFRVSRSLLINHVFVMNGAIVAGNFDIGIYDKEGTRLVSSGVTAQAGVSSLQTINVTDTMVGPGLFYVALAASSIGARYYQVGLGLNNARCQLMGMAQQEAALPLPANAVFISATSFFIPLCGFTARSVV